MVKKITVLHDCYDLEYLYVHDKIKTPSYPD
jgi:hypothetical protein